MRNPPFRVGNCLISRHTWKALAISGVVMGIGVARGGRADDLKASRSASPNVLLTSDSNTVAEWPGKQPMADGSKKASSVGHAVNPQHSKRLRFASRARRQAISQSLTKPTWRIKVIRLSSRTANSRSPRHGLRRFVYGSNLVSGRRTENRDHAPGRLRNSWRARGALPIRAAGPPDRNSEVQHARSDQSCRRALSASAARSRSASKNAVG